MGSMVDGERTQGIEDIASRRFKLICEYSMDAPIQVLREVSEQMNPTDIRTDSYYFRDFAWVHDRFPRRKHKTTLIVMQEQIFGMAFRSLEAINQYYRAILILVDENDFDIAISAHARSILEGSLSVARLFQPDLDSGTHFCRLLANEAKQRNDAYRMSQIASCSPDDGQRKPRSGPSRAETGLHQFRAKCERMGFTVEQQQSGPSITKIRYGEHEAPVRWNVTAEVKKLPGVAEYSWTLVSGSTHVEPWATIDFSRSRFDLFPMILSGLILPATRVLVESLAVYFGIDPNNHLAKVDLREASIRETFLDYFDSGSAGHRDE